MRAMVTDSPMHWRKRILSSMRDAASEAGVEIVTGDTKVVQRGSADKICINTSGVGGDRTFGQHLDDARATWR